MLHKSYQEQNAEGLTQAPTDYTIPNCLFINHEA